MNKTYLIKSVKFIGQGIGLLCLTTVCEYISYGDNNDKRWSAVGGSHIPSNDKYIPVPKKV